jgi:hypothetical protein
MKAGGLAPWNLIQPTISLEMPVPSQGHYDFHSFPVVDWFCLFIYLWLSLWKIVRSSVILLLPLLINMKWTEKGNLKKGHKYNKNVDIKVSGNDALQVIS